MPEAVYYRELGRFGCTAFAPCIVPEVAAEFSRLSVRQAIEADRANDLGKKRWARLFSGKAKASAMH